MCAWRDIEPRFDPTPYEYAEPRATELAYDSDLSDYRAFAQLFRFFLQYRRSRSSKFCCHVTPFDEKISLRWQAQASCLVYPLKAAFLLPTPIRKLLRLALKAANRDLRPLRPEEENSSWRLQKILSATHVLFVVVVQSYGTLERSLHMLFKPQCVAPSSSRKCLLSMSGN